MWPGGVRSWSIGCASALITLAFCASVNAEVGTSSSQAKKVQSAKKAEHKACYVLIGSGIPQPCDRFAGAIPNSMYPIEIIGRRPR
ncbi:MAG: hypothetical protein QOG67_961 [Verrucomicrobiota bacterium]|jgi:hypothetical protein